ncbi:hypothetical protein AB3G45_00270 [Shinella sp. S4-D37]|uniref:hypothetical protein n=1 Tax=Shinella sp. S4-D37 TaxID=3161999 RepID=UPI0034674A12
MSVHYANLYFKWGGLAVLVDASVLGDPPCRPDHSKRDIAAAAGATMEAITGNGDENTAMALMARGAAALVGRLSDAGDVRRQRHPLAAARHHGGRCAQDRLGTGCGPVGRRADMGEEGRRLCAAGLLPGGTAITRGGVSTEIGHPTRWPAIDE